MLSRRLQILLDEDRHERLLAESRRQKRSVAALIREAIDRAYPGDAAKRRAAGRAILAAPPIPAPSLEELRAELEDLHSGGM